MACRVDVANISGGMVAWELSLALCLGRSPYIWSPNDSVARFLLNRHRRTLSYFQVYLPCSNAVGHPWNAVSSFDEYKLHLESNFCFHHFNFKGVGRVPDAGPRMNDSCPAGRPSIILTHTLFSFSKVQMSPNFF